MKLLILTQAVDTNDSTLGFFARWIEEFSKHCEKVTVICLRKGEYSLPKNVEVLSLGKEAGASRFTRAARFFRYIFTKRREYDAVFVHMNPEYVVLGGWLWKLLRKKVVLWYVHKSVNLKLRVAVWFTDAVATASKDSFRLKSSKVRVVGHGIDTDFFSPDTHTERGNWALSVGRLMKSKRHDLAIEAAHKSGLELRIAGEGPERQPLEEFAKERGAHVRFLGALTQAQLRDEYRSARFLIHTSETGSLDKVVLEALACGLPVVSVSEAFRAGFPMHFSKNTVDDLAKTISLMFRESDDPQTLAEFIAQNHSISGCICSIIALYHPNTI